MGPNKARPRHGCYFRGRGADTRKTCCKTRSAKVLVAGEPNVAYICSRYYRAPELIFGASQYTTSIGAFLVAAKG